MPPAAHAQADLASLVELDVDDELDESDDPDPAPLESDPAPLESDPELFESELDELELELESDDELLSDVAESDFAEVAALFDEPERLSVL